MTRSGAAGMVLAALAWAAPVQAANTTYLIQPDPVEMDCALGTERMHEAIEVAGKKRGWTVIDTQPDMATVQYIKGDNKHILVADVKFTDADFRVRYKDSTNLNYSVVEAKTREIYKAGAQRIHPRANGWLSNLSKDLRKTTRSMCRA